MRKYTKYPSNARLRKEHRPSHAVTEIKAAQVSFGVAAIHLGEASLCVGDQRHAKYLASCSRLAELAARPFGRVVRQLELTSVSGYGKRAALESRLVLAAMHIGQARQLILQESRDAGWDHSTRLKTIASGLGDVVIPLQQIGRAHERKITPERIPPQLAEHELRGVAQ